MRHFVQDALADPNTAYLVLLAGLLAVYYECIRPGSILPGMAGAVTTIVGAHALWAYDPGWRGIHPMASLMGIPFAALTIFLVRQAIRARRNKISSA